MSKEADAVMYLEVDEEPASTSRGVPIMVRLLAMASMYILGAGTAYASSVVYYFAFL